MINLQLTAVKFVLLQVEASNPRRSICGFTFLISAKNFLLESENFIFDYPFIELYGFALDPTNNFVDITFYVIIQMTDIHQKKYQK